MTHDIFHVGVKALVTNQENQILLLQACKINKDKTKRFYWDIPGGRIHAEESAQCALEREVQEETGITQIMTMNHLGMIFTAIRIPVDADTTAGLILSVYACVIADNTPITLSDEHIHYEWVTPDEAAQRLASVYSPSFIDMIKPFSIKKHTTMVQEPY